MFLLNLPGGRTGWPLGVMTAARFVPFLTRLLSEVGNEWTEALAFNPSVLFSLLNRVSAIGTVASFTMAEFLKHARNTCHTARKHKAITC